MSSMVERLRAQREAMKNKGQKGGGFLKLPKEEGETRIRILPAKNWYNEDGTVNDEPDLFYKRFGIHWVDRQPHVCPRLTNGDGCPICEAVNELYESGDESDTETARQFKVKKRHYVNAVTVDDDDNITSEPMIFEFGQKLLENILEWCCDEEYYDITDPQKGYTFRVIKKIVDGFPNYDASKPSKNPTSISEDTMKELLEKSADIHTIVDNRIRSYEEMDQVLNFGGGESSASLAAEDVDQDELLARIEGRLES